MTEQEAKTKTCHKTLIPVSADGSAPWFSPQACIGSACMAWRWLSTHINDPENPKGDLIWSRDTHGFCGLAGHPHEGFGQ